MSYVWQIFHSLASCFAPVWARLKHPTTTPTSILFNPMKWLELTVSKHSRLQNRQYFLLQLTRVRHPQQNITCQNQGEFIVNSIKTPNKKIFRLIDCPKCVVWTLHQKKKSAMMVPLHLDSVFLNQFLSISIIGASLMLSLQYFTGHDVIG